MINFFNYNAWCLRFVCWGLMVVCLSACAIDEESGDTKEPTQNTQVEKSNQQVCEPCKVPASLAVKKPKDLQLYIDASRSMQGFVKVSGGKFMEVIDACFSSEIIPQMFHWGIPTATAQKNDYKPIKTLKEAVDYSQFSLHGNLYADIFHYALEKRKENPNACIVILSDGVFSQTGEKALSNDLQITEIKQVLLTAQAEKTAFHLLHFQSNFTGDYISTANQIIPVQNVNRNFYAFVFSAPEHIDFVQSTFQKLNPITMQSFGVPRQIQMERQGDCSRLLNNKANFLLKGKCPILANEQALKNGLEVTHTVQPDAKKEWKVSYKPTDTKLVLEFDENKFDKATEGILKLRVLNRVAAQWNNLCYNQGLGFNEDPKALDHNKTWRFEIILKAIENAYTQDILGENCIIVK